MSRSNLPLILNKIYNRYHSPAYLEIDPLVCVRRFKDPSQIEIAGLLASSLAYGRVESIIQTVDSILGITGKDIHSFVNNTSFTEKKKHLRYIKHRFNNGLDIALLLEAVKKVLDKYGSLEKLFLNSFNRGNNTIKVAGCNFVSAIKQYGMESNGKKRRSSFEYLLPSPLSGSACKRLNMYFRWMIRREDGIDLGVWSHVSPSILIMPVDVHVTRVARFLKLTSRKSTDWKMAEEITARLRRVDPDDPVKYDFSLCRFGMKELTDRN